jgi:sec-independent protein translocase protein TatB
MDFLGMGPLEILLILILGFLFLGPEKLPQMAAKAGQLYRKFKKASFDLTRTITEDFSEEKKAVEEDVSALNKSFTEDITKDLEQDRKMVGEDLSEISKSITADIQPEDQVEAESKKDIETPSDTGITPPKKQRKKRAQKRTRDIDE